VIHFRLKCTLCGDAFDVVIGERESSTTAMQNAAADHMKAKHPA